jgi:Druantia protein DruA
MRICGRDFSPADIDWIREQLGSLPDLNRVLLSRLFCRHVGWRKPDSGLKEMSCRVALLRLERSGLIRLPAPRTRPAAVKPVKRTRKGEPKADIHVDANQTVLSIEPVDKKSSALWNELIDRYHYLGHRRMGGAQMRLFIRADGELVALLGFSAAAYRVSPRDRFIGWTDEARRQRLHRVIDNSRFLMLPWVKGQNLASRILASCLRRLPDLWEQRYHYRPVLVETFVEKQRFTGACYKAANFIPVGETLGRGKWDREHAKSKPVKRIFLYLLDRRFKELLCR